MESLYVRPPRPGPRGSKRKDERNEAIVRLFLSGKTQPEIGAIYGITGSGVGNIVRAYGVKRRDGGKMVASSLREAAKSERILRYFKSLDCSPSEFYSTDQFKRAKRAFFQQRKSAGKRGIGWRLTFGQWWRIWIESGHWGQRGRGRDSFVMARHGDAGAYSVGNVYIASNAVNVSESQHVRGRHGKLFLAHLSSLSIGGTQC